MTDRITYVPGSATALVGPVSVLLLPRDAAPARVAQLWPLVRDGADLDALLEALVAHGLRALGPFVLLHGNRVVVRGTGRAEIEATGRTLTGATVTTWAEHAVDPDAGIGLRLDDETDGDPLPVVAGVVRAVAVTVAPSPAAVERAPVPEPEPDPEPEREPEPEARVGHVPVAPDTIAARRTDASTPATSELADADDDESTVLRSQPPDRGAHRAPLDEPTQPGPDEVWGVLCPAGHASPPRISACRTCGAPMPDGDPVPVPRPPLGRLRVSDGTEVVLDRTVVIGRAPTAERFSGAGSPRLVRVTSPQHDISRTHVEVRVEDWDVLVVDLSSNGTRLIRPGAEPQMLPPGEPLRVLPGSVLDLGDGVSVDYESGTG